MATTATVNGQAAVSSTPVQRGFPDLPCPLCGNVDNSVTLNLYDVTLFKCEQCGDDFGPDTVQEFIDKWQAVLAWVNQAPVS